MSIDTPEAWAGITLAALDQDPTNRADALYALWGALRDRPRGTPPAGNVEALVRLLAARVGQIEKFELFQLAQTFLSLDWSAAVDRLTQEDVFQFERGGVRYVLDALHRAKVILPDAPTAKLLEWCRLAWEAPDDNSLAEIVQMALPLIARTAPEEAAPCIEKFRDRRGYGSSGAAEAVAVLHGVENAYEYVAGRVWTKDEHGQVHDHFAELTRPQQVYWVCFEVDSQVCNGGFEQFFFNPSGRFARQAPEALAEVGAPTCASLMRQALEILGSENVAAAEKTYLNITEPELRTRLSDLDRLYFEDGAAEAVLELLKYYAARHPDHFRK